MPEIFWEYHEALERALVQEDAARDAVHGALQKGVDNIFLVGCGGSLAIMLSGKYILEVHSRIPFYVLNSSEFIHLRPAALGQKSLVVLGSSSGTTLETIAAAGLARERGAATIAITRKADSPLAGAVDNTLSVETTTGIADCKLLLLYLVLFSLPGDTEARPRFPDIRRAMAALPSSLVGVRKEAQQRAVEFAQAYKDETLFYTIGAGACWGQAYSYAICILEEMQWITAQPVHAGEYFHGPFEVIDKDSTLLVLQGEDLSRPLVERVISFSKGITRRMTVIDTKAYALPDIADNLRGYFSPFVVLAVLDRFSHHLSSMRGHPLSVRRYMGKISY